MLQRFRFYSNEKPSNDTSLEYYNVYEFHMCKYLVIITQ